MSCKEYTEWLALYVLDELAVPEKRKVEEHLESCDACQALLAQLRAAVEMLSRNPQESLSDTEKSGIEREVLWKLASRVPRPRAQRKWVFRWTVRVAAAFLIFVLGYQAHTITGGNQNLSQTPATIQQLRQATDHRQGLASSLRFSKEGLTLIAKGRKSLSEMTAQQMTTR